MPTRIVRGSLGRQFLERIAPDPRLWLRRRQTRAALARLEEEQLRDIGKTRAEAEAEARKPFWRD